MKQFLKPVFVLVLCMAAVVFTGCSKDDDNKDAITLSSLEGEWEGTFDFVGEPSALNPDAVTKNDVPISIKIENGQVVLPDFPAATLVEALLGEEGAAGLIPMLGRISYAATIGDVEATADMLSTPLSTTRLDIPIYMGETLFMTVWIGMSAPGKMIYTAPTKTLIFTLKTLTVQLVTTAPGEPDALINTLTFSVKKK